MLTVSAPDTERTNQVVVRSAMSEKRTLKSASPKNFQGLSDIFSSNTIHNADLGSLIFYRTEQLVLCFTS